MGASMSGAASVTGLVFLRATRSACQKHRRFARRLFVGLFTACVAAVGSSASAQASDVVITDKGPVRGIETPTMFKFLGIPYADAPVGVLRWHPPQPHLRWITPLNATHFANHCPQLASLAGGEASVTEDCLFLNVYTPTRREAGGHPVMVWIHGHALSGGESDNYDPIKLVGDGDVIVVTINYRLGVLGFLTHPALTAESPGGSGNYGLMDQQFALSWVQRNIAHFGGNPDNVTIFGGSAGGLSVHSHLASPMAAGLFHKAIVESGASSLTQPTLAVAEASGTAFANLAGCSSQTAVCLRALPVTTILANQATVFPNGFVPTVDGKVLAQSVGAAFASGQFNRVPVIEGSNHDEARFFVGLAELVNGTPLTAADYIPAIVATLGVSLPVATSLASFYPLAAYPPPSTAPSIALGALGTDAIFACNARLVSKLMARYVPIFQYEFNDPNPPLNHAPLSFPAGAYHTSEVQYLFDLSALGFPELSTAQGKLSDAMVGYWTSFARTGNPNSRRRGRAAPLWPPYGASDQFQSLNEPAPAAASGFAADHKCAVWGSP
jgi:para-nitrobenzyl esterase